jgi:hypothetical protein
LQFDGDVALDRFRKVEVFDAWEAFAAGITGSGEEFARAFGSNSGPGGGW